MKTLTLFETGLSLPASSLAFMCFKEDMLAAFDRLEYLEKREKDLSDKMKASAAALAESEEKRRSLLLQIQMKEEEVKDKARKFEREFFNRLEDDKIKMRKLLLELNGKLCIHVFRCDYVSLYERSCPSGVIFE